MKTLCTTLALVATLSSANAQDKLSASLDSANLVTVLSGKPWSHQGASGVFRICKYEVGSSHHMHEVILEWITIPDDGISPRTVHTRTKILSLDKKYRVGPMVLKSHVKSGGKTVSVLTFDVIGTYDLLDAREYTVTIEAVGKVSVESKRIELAK